jgi:hypothetical protein
MGRVTKEALAVSLCCFALSSCATSVAPTHRDPSLKTLRFQRAAVVMAFAHGYRIDATRRSGEDAFRRQLPSLNLEPTNSLLRSPDIRNGRQLRAWAVDRGFDGILYVWFESSSVKTFPHLEIIPDEVVVRARYRVTIWSLPDERELWSATITRSDAFPLSADLKAISKAVSKRLRADGLIE